jgi:hypothetical protein
MKKRLRLVRIRLNISRRKAWRYDWVMGQSVTEKRIETYCTKTWLGIDWIARDPKDKIERDISAPMGAPRLLPEGEFLRQGRAGIRKNIAKLIPINTLM